MKKKELFKKNAVKIENSEYTFIELIDALSNSIKHKNDLEIVLDKISYDYANKIPTNKIDSVEKIKKAYHEKTFRILDSFNLLTNDEFQDINDNKISSIDEIYSISKGIMILDCNKNLYNIANKLYEWSKNIKQNIALLTTNQGNL